MTTDAFKSMCSELVKLSAPVDSIPQLAERLQKLNELAVRARALLAQPEPEGPKPVVDYSRVPEIATEAQIRSAAQYLVKKRNCDGDLIPAIEYAIARWGRPTPQPVAVSERLPSAADCDAEGNCWWFDPHADGAWYVDTFQSCYTHWLPANALPTPEATHD